MKGVTFGVGKGECFGLLGTNGAGKSSVFNILTGYERATSGDALIDGISMLANQKLVTQLQSYCPQSDVVFGNLTVSSLRS